MHTSRNHTRLFVVLHLLLMLYSLSGICSKLAGQAAFLSPRFMLCYGGVLVLLMLYALGWQQIIKRLPLTLAFANKAVTVVWGLVWGALFFKEAVTPGKLAGAALIIGGIVLYSTADAGGEAHDA